MLSKLSVVITKIFQTRDELSFRNIRGRLWAIILIFPLSVIKGNLRFYDNSIALTGFESDRLIAVAFGFGWLILALIPKNLITKVLRLSAIISAIILPFLMFMPMGFSYSILYIVFKFFNGLNAASAFFLFCFVLNNIERLFGMALIQFYYSLYYITLRTISVLHTTYHIWISAIAMTAYLVVVFVCNTKQQEINTDSKGKGSGVPFVLGLDIVHYMIMCLINYIEWTDNTVSALAFGIGTFVAIGLVSIIQLQKGHNPLYIWILFLTFTLLGLGALLYNTPMTFLFGSFSYGLGDSIGYIIITYISASVIRQSRSLNMFKLYCLVSFIEYIVISGAFSFYFFYFAAPSKYLAFGVVLVVVSICLLCMPLIQRKLFEADWTDGLNLQDIEKFSQNLAETEAINEKDNLNLTPREKEIFTMLLDGVAPKEIAYTLKISYDTVRFHQKNLYRKLNIQSRAELFARYTTGTSEKPI